LRPMVSVQVHRDRARHARLTAPFGCSSLPRGPSPSVYSFSELDLYTAGRSPLPDAQRPSELRPEGFCAPRKIRTCDLWLRRPGHACGETAAASNPDETNATDCNQEATIATSRNDVFPTLLPGRSRNADLAGGPENWPLLSSILRPLASGQTSTLIEQTVPVLTLAYVLDDAWSVQRIGHGLFSVAGHERVTQADIDADLAPKAIGTEGVGEPIAVPSAHGLLLAYRACLARTSHQSGVSA
jgi:hypothetical protein